MKTVCLSILLFFSSSSSFAFQHFDDTPYQIAFSEISKMIDGKVTYSFKDAVFLTETAWFDGMLDYNQYLSDIEHYKELSIFVRESDKLEYVESDVEDIRTHASIFRVMTDSIQLSVANNVLLNVPFQYDFTDVFGREDWSNMFVTKLFLFNSGNCHSLPYLYKILAEELGVTAHLALAPNHIYIKNYSQQTGWYNTELTSASFPIDAWLMASGYIHLDAIRNGVYMDTLSQKESLALTLLDLAQGYERKFGIQDGEFILRAANKALEVNPDFMNALLLKAETQKKLFEDKMLLDGFDDPNVLIQQDEEAHALFLEMQSIYVRIHELGYRQMPEEMYLDWLALLESEREKYRNKNIPIAE